MATTEGVADSRKLASSDHCQSNTAIVEGVSDSHKNIDVIWPLSVLDMTIVEGVSDSHK